MKKISVNALVKMVGINPNTLRGWERRYGALVPERDEEGRRLYSSKEVERVKMLWSLVRQGHAISSVANLNDVQLKKMLDEFIPQAPSTLFESEKKILDDVVQALENFNLEKVHVALQQARFGMSTKDIMLKLINPLMIRVGELVEVGRFSIAQEHLFSSMLRDYLGGLHQSLGPYEISSRASSKSLIVATREGDIHEFGILSAAIFANLNRYKCFYLGPSMPMEDLALAAAKFKVDALLLGLMKIPKRLEVISSRDFIVGLDHLLPLKVCLLVGGPDAKSLEGVKLQRELVLVETLSELGELLQKGL